jgi:hypothetical protein
MDGVLHDVIFYVLSVVNGVEKHVTCQRVVGKLSERKPSPVQENKEVQEDKPVKVEPVPPVVKPAPVQEPQKPKTVDEGKEVKEDKPVKVVPVTPAEKPVPVQEPQKPKAVDESKEVKEDKPAKVVPVTPAEKPAPVQEPQKPKATEEAKEVKEDKPVKTETVPPVVKPVPVKETPKAVDKTDEKGSQTKPADKTTEVKETPKPKETQTDKGSVKEPETKKKTEESAVPQTPKTNVPQGNQGTQTWPKQQPAQTSPSIPNNQESYGAPVPRKPGASCSSGYRGIFEVGYGIGFGTYGMDNLKLNLINGFRFCPNYSLGLGLGLRRYTDVPGNHPDGNLISAEVQMPVFIDFRKSLTRGNVAPYIGIGIGSSFGFRTEGIYNEGLFVNPSLGIRFKMSDNSAITIGVAHELQNMEYVKTLPDVSPFEKYANSFSFTLGISF